MKNHAASITTQIRNQAGHNLNTIMTLEQYHQKLTTLMLQNPNAKKLRVITSSDDEGNQFHPVIFDPTLGSYDDIGNFDQESKSPNAVCVN